MHILGVGALGTVFANRLIRAGVPTTLILRPKTVLDRSVEICKESKTVEIQVENLLYKDFPGTEKYERSRAHFVGTDELEPLGSNESLKNAKISRLLVLTKAHQAKSALENISSHLSRGALVFLLCNGGLALHEELSKSNKLAHVHLVPGVTTHGAFRQPEAKNPLCAVNAGGTGENWFGLIEPNYAGSPKISSTVKAAYYDALKDLNKAKLGGVDESMHSAIIRRLWIKLGVNCVMNPHTALLKCTNGQYLNQQASLKTIENVCNEVAKISHYDPLCQPPLNAEELVSFILEKVNRNNKSSMFQDVCSGSPTEIDYLNAWIAKRSAQEGFNAVVNETLSNLVKICEEQYSLGGHERLYEYR